MFPALLLLHPRRAESILAFRERTLGAARDRARQHGYAGAMFPWEADPQTGADQTPYSAHLLSESEILGAQAAAWTRLFETGGTLKPPYEGCTETASNEVGPFLTGSGSYLQSLMYGLTGLRVRQAGLVAAYPPALPTGWRSLTLRNIIFRGRRLTIRVTRERSGVVRLSGLE